ncbi:Ccc1 family [Xylariaceae sp. FL0594]|nr:Ccc1 family [Xylariaceae sp. FL0594]
MRLLDVVPGWTERREASSHQTFPAYSTLATTPDTVAEITSTEDDSHVMTNSYANSYASLDSPIVSPSLSRFFADFTLGFADGLTVPFALTAGLSSLGQTSTVIYAGMAEICAGCISMGIGGYLAAKGEQRQVYDDETCQAGKVHNTVDEDREKRPSTPPPSVQDYLAALQLPPDLLRSVIAHVECSPEVEKRIREGPAPSGCQPEPQPAKASPVISGLSVSLGYLLGGLLPLSPYFVVSSVTGGLVWSFAVCITALFLFGFTRECVLRLATSCESWDSMRAKGRLLQWDVIKHGLWEGVRMVVFGGIAAVAAVLCVRLFDGFVS